MKDYICLGPVPCDEECQQVGTPDYNPIAARNECSRYASQLLKKFGNPPEGARIGWKSFPHDFGNYMEVVVYYDDDLPESVKYAFGVESDQPSNWE